MKLEDIAALIQKSESIAILPHISADGDAIGSSLALAIALEKADKKASVFFEEDIPSSYSFLPGIKLSEVYAASKGNYDTVIALDTGDLARLGSRSEIFDKARITINIDHHITNSEFAVHNFVDKTSAAVGEIIFRLIKTAGWQLDRDISTCLYSAIAADTGGFRYSNTSSLTHRIVSELIDYGIDIADISQRVFDSSSYEKVKLTGAAIDSLELFEKGKIAVMTVSNKTIRNIGAKEEDSEGIINIARNIRGVEVAVMLRQWDNGEIKVNLRAASYVDVSAIASLYSGGGHKKAAGFIAEGSLDSIKEKLLKDIREVL